MASAQQPSWAGNATVKAKGRILRAKLRKLRQENSARSQAAGVAVGDKAAYIPPPSKMKKVKRRKAGPWLNGRPINADRLGHRAPGSYEFGKRR
jgi:hypothetical protein